MVTLSFGLEIPTESRQITDMQSRNTRLAMGLIYLQPFDRVGGVAVLKLVGLRGVPEPRIIHGRDVEVLGDASNPSGQTVDALPRREGHGDLDHRVMGNGANAGGLGRHVALPHTIGRLGHGVGGV